MSLVVRKSKRMDVLRIGSDEGLDAFGKIGTGAAAIAHIANEARIMGDDAPKFGPCHAGVGQEFFDSV
jgi:hypothetical protein